MTGTDPTVVEQTLRIEARPEIVWRHWTDPDRMREWWGTATLDARPGGAFVVARDHGPVMRGEYLELVPHERIVFSFGWDPAEDAPDLAPGSSRVEITLTPDGGGTILVLRHSGLPLASSQQHRLAWSHFLPLLAAAAGAAG